MGPTAGAPWPLVRIQRYARACLAGRLIARPRKRCSVRALGGAGPAGAVLATGAGLSPNAMGPVRQAVGNPGSLRSSQPCSLHGNGAWSAFRS
jgi:hypothetical protein